MTGSAGQLRVQSGWLAGSTLPIAPLAEQQRILLRLEEVLSELDAGVAELLTAQKKLTQYRQSLLKSAVDGSLTAAWRSSDNSRSSTSRSLPSGWNWVPMEQCCRVVSGYAFSSKSFTSEGTAVAKIANVGHGFYVDDPDPDYLDTPFEVSHSDYVVEPGDVLIALTRPITKDALKSCRYPLGVRAAEIRQAHGVA
jgi:type I restriction enzyme S subunit